MVRSFSRGHVIRILEHILRSKISTSTHWLMIISLKQPYFNNKHTNKGEKGNNGDMCTTDLLLSTQAKSSFLGDV